ncbi:MAG: urea ABC transporter permease subunit UrtC [Akkermansiaceae bacterium]|jgi:urea transport system permease protein|nr:urea ABC transporter permease subunit UrtC [Akkermansiaceae bacterium]
MNPQPFTSRVHTPLLIIAAVFLVVVMPVLNATGFISDFTLGNWGKYLCYGILAISIDLLWGYTGLLSLGQALFFTLGGYMMGMHLMRMIGGEGVPTFLSMVGRTEWPSFFLPFSSFPFALLMIILVPGLLAYVFGYLAFRSRIKGVYFSILTQALTYGAALLFFRNELLMGGNNGFTDFRTLLGFSLRDDGTKRGLYIATAILLVVVVAFCKWLTGSRFGLIQRAIRDSENRVLFSGYATANFKLFIFVISAVIASFAGALFVPQVGIINPSEMETGKSLEAVVWVALGGRGTIVGPVVGAVSVNAIKSWASSGATADYWPLMLGGAFVLVVLFMPKGIVGIPGQIAEISARIKRNRNQAAPDQAPTPPSQATDP